MSRVAVIAGFLATLALVAAGLVLYLAYGVNTEPSSRERIEGLTDTARIHWSPEGPIYIEAENTSDFLLALGYAHGMDRTWIALLSRQIALGQLSEWFGVDALPVDRLSRKLSLATTSMAVFDRLPLEVQERYERYAKGMNAALASRAVLRQAPLVLLEVKPDPWEPWHSLAVERLWAWIAAPVQSIQSEAAGVPQLRQEDRDLRAILHVYGMTDNVVMVAGGGAQTRHLYRYVTGDSGHPVFQEFEYANSQGSVLDGLSIPGTLAVPAGRLRDRSWTYLLSSAVSVDTVRITAQTAIRIEYDLIHGGGGIEEVVRRETLDGDLLLNGSDLSDSAGTVLRWAGLRDVSDATGWSALLDGRTPEFAVMRDDGITIGGAERPTISGSPAFSYSHPSGVVLVTNSGTGPSLAERLVKVIAGQTDVQSDWDLLHDTFSEAAAVWNDEFVAAVDSVQIRTVREDEALDYLRNWDLSYRGASIAASILETARAYMSGVQRDTLSPRLASDALSSAVNVLTGRYGPDMREWRWESVMDLTVYYPGWSAPALTDDHRTRQFKNEFLPVGVLGRGHPTTLAWGPTLGRKWRKAPSAWEGLLAHDVNSVFELERPLVTYSSFLGRFLAENRATVNVRGTSERQTERSTELQPAR